MAARRTTPSIGRMLALLAGAAGVGFGSTALAQRHGQPVEQPVRVRAVAERAAPSDRTRRVPKLKAHASAVPTRRPQPRRAANAPKRRHASSRTPSAAPVPAPAAAPAPVPAPAPALQAPAAAPVPVAAPVPATPAPVTVVSGGS